MEVERAPEPEPSSVALPAPKATSKIASSQLFQLIWFEPEAMPRIRRTPPWRSLLDALENEPEEPLIDDAVLDDDSVEVEDHRDIFELLARGDAEGHARIPDFLRRGTHGGGKFVAPLGLFAGHLHFLFDPLEELKATISSVLPFKTVDESLESAIEDATRFVQSPALMGPPEVCQALIKRLEKAFRRLERLVSNDYLHNQTRRVLLEKRHYQRSDIFGGTHIRAMFLPTHDPNNDGAVFGYLPDAIAQDLPMFERLRVRFIAAVEPAASQFEPHPATLRILALGRVAEQPV